MLNRGAVIVRPNQPFLDWAAQLDDSGITPDPRDEQTVYLISEYDDEVDALQILSEGYDIIFETELYGWHTREGKDRSTTFVVSPKKAVDRVLIQTNRQLLLRREKPTRRNDACTRSSYHEETLRLFKIG